MPTVEEKNAGFDVAHTKIKAWVETLIPDHYIPMVGNLRQIALQHLDSADGRKMLLDEVSSILIAAEQARGTHTS